MRPIRKVHLRMLSLSLLLLLSACTARQEPLFNGSRTGNDSQFLMSYTICNKTDSQTLHAQAGDILYAQIVVEGGQLSYTIQKEQEPPLASGEGVTTSEEFEVALHEGGAYTVTVTGEHARGSVQFLLRPPEA